MPTYKYTGFTYSPRNNGSLVSFIAPVGDIKAWAGVPRKNFNYQHGFQRTLSEKRVAELREFYALNDKNLTPTSIIVAVRAGACAITALSKKDQDGNELMPPGLCQIEMEVPAFSSESTKNLIDSAIDLLKERLGSDSTTSVENDLNAAIDIAIEAETADEADQVSDIETSAAGDLDEIPSSHLLHFFTELLAIKSGKSSIEDEPKLREVLYALLKPAIIVDGQHRVYGAAAYTESMQFNVNAIPDADWLEQVFQFVIINQKAKPIEPAFLHSIVATSLTDAEIGHLYKRLQKSGVDVDRAQFMNRINVDAISPFRGMIDFDVEGASGFLKFPGMSALARSFRNISKDFPGLVGAELNWQDENTWLGHFYAFWTGIRDYFSALDPRLWSAPSEDNPNNLLKIVTLQEIQRMVLESWADARAFKLEDAASTKIQSRNYWTGFPPQFFSDEWRKKGLQTAVGRKYLSEAIQTTRRNLDRKGWGHRRLGLFQDA
jgi:hypothetical protein